MPTAMLKKLLQKVAPTATGIPAPASPEQRAVLNVGGNSKEIPIPPHFNGWRHDLLDIDPAGQPDLLCDARELGTLSGGRYDAIYCSHNLEHYMHHHARRVIKGFLHMLKEDGFADIRVPDIAQVMRHCVTHNSDLDDVLYQAPGGPVLVRDVLWGWGRQIEQSGNDFYAHKTGFTQVSLTRILEDSGFAEVFIDAGGEPAFEVRALAFKRPGPNPHKAVLGIG